jgi:ABC-type uncharacterized transport system ATPase subunit
VRLELRGITKRFPGVIANDRVDLVVEPGEVHGLLGENGAGKSTLMNILYGLYHADEGEIFLDDVPVTFAGPGDAIDAGIGMVHQHFQLVGNFTVAQNVVLGAEPMRSLGRYDRRRASSIVEELSVRYGLPVEPNAFVEELPVGVQQRVEILKALYRDASLLILDEPTAVLTPQEADDLFEAIRGLQASGRSIVFISHKLREHRALADRVSVLRRGAIVGTADPRATSDEVLAELMVGRPVDLTVHKEPSDPGEAVLQVTGLSVIDASGAVRVHDVDLTVHRGEIVAIAGVEGNGQSQLVRAISGLERPETGAVELLGRDLTAMSRQAVLRSGVGHVPEDRTTEGLVAEFTVAENLMLDLWNVPPFAGGGLVRFDAVAAHAADQVEAFDIRTPDVHTAVSTLSGGNQQKVVVAREFSRENDLLICHQPTRGVDVGSIEYIHARIVAQRDGGAAVLIVSSELDEVLALADRVAVLYQGQLRGPYPMPVAKELIGRLMAGGDPDELFEVGGDRNDNGTHT